MPVLSYNPITQADLDALATLANSKVSPYAASTSYYQAFRAGYEFSYLDDTIDPPSAVTGAPGSTPGIGFYNDGDRAEIRVYSYKDVSGRKHFSLRYAIGNYVLPTGSNQAIDWSWTPPAGGADGYVLVTGAPFSGWVGQPWSFWRLQTATTLTDTALGWDSSESDVFDGDGYLIINPVTGASWWRLLNYIRQDLFTLAAAETGLTDADLCVSGPWCCAVGSRLWLAQSSRASHKNIEFYSHTGDLTTDVEVTIETLVGTAAAPLAISDGTPGPSPNYYRVLGFTAPGGGTLTGQITWAQTGSGTGWTHTLAVASGSITIDSEVWTATSTTLTLEFTLTLPAGASSVSLAITAAAGDITTETIGINQYSTAQLVAVLVTETQMLTPAATNVVHYSETGRKLTVSDPDLTSWPFTLDATNYWPSVYAAGLDGVWAAVTLPVFGVFNQLEGMLPNYAGYPGASGLPAPRDAAPLTDNGVTPVQPAVNSVPSLWPVFRDTDWLTWKYLASVLKPVPFFNNGFFTQLDPITLAPGQTAQYVLFLTSNFLLGKIETYGAASAVIYFSPSAPPDPDSPGSYSASAAGVIRLPADATPTSGGNNYYAIRNETASPINFRPRLSLFTTTGGSFAPADLALFFKRDNSGRGAIEPYTYNFPWTKTTFDTGHENTETPLLGYCISELIVIRPATGGTVKTVPSTGQPELAVAIGVMLGTDSENTGTFHEFSTVTIPADTGRVVQTVFWPVLEGAALAYQATSAVEVQARVNFQPALLAEWETTDAPYGTTPYGRHSGPAARVPSLLRFTNQNAVATSQLITLPIAAPIYNDIETILTAM